MTLNCAGLISKEEFHQFVPCCVLEMYATERFQAMMPGKYFHSESLVIWSFPKIRPKMLYKSYCMSDNKIHCNFPLQNISQHSRIFIFGLCTFLLEWSWKLTSHFNFCFLSFFKVSCIYTMYVGHVHPSLSLKSLSVLHLIFSLASYSLIYFCLYLTHRPQFCPCAHSCWVYSLRHQEPNCSLAS